MSIGFTDVRNACTGILNFGAQTFRVCKTLKVWACT